MKSTPIKVSVFIQSEYQKILLKVVRQMNTIVNKEVLKLYRSNRERITQDSTPANSFKQLFNKLYKDLLNKFDDISYKISNKICTKIFNNVDLQIEKQVNVFRKKNDPTLKNFRFTKKTQPVEDVQKALIEANVSLIKSIPEKYLTEVENVIFESLSRGDGITELSEKLHTRFKVSKNRAIEIARDQTNKITSSSNLVRQKELGITKNYWVHTKRGKSYRKSHVAADGKEFDIEKGCLIDGEYIFPGEKINCYCISSPVLTNILDKDLVK